MATLRNPLAVKEGFVQRCLELGFTKRAGIEDMWNGATNWLGSLTPGQTALLTGGLSGLGGYGAASALGSEDPLMWGLGAGALGAGAGGIGKSYSNELGRRANTGPSVLPAASDPYEHYGKYTTAPVSPEEKAKYDALNAKWDAENAAQDEADAKKNTSAPVQESGINAELQKLVDSNHATRARLEAEAHQGYPSTDEEYASHDALLDLERQANNTPEALARKEEERNRLYEDKAPLRKAREHLRFTDPTEVHDLRAGQAAAQDAALAERMAAAEKAQAQIIAQARAVQELKKMERENKPFGPGYPKPWQVEYERDAIKQMNAEYENAQRKNAKPVPVKDTSSVEDFFR